MSSDLTKSVRLAKQLPPRQRQVLRQLGECRSRREIADDLKISEHTVNTHCRILYARLGIQTLSEAVRIAGLVRI